MSLLLFLHTHSQRAKVWTKEYHFDYVSQHYGKLPSSTPISNTDDPQSQWSCSRRQTFFISEYCLLTIQLHTGTNYSPTAGLLPLHTHTKNHTSQSHALKTFRTFETCTNLFLVSVSNQGFLRVKIKCPMAFFSIKSLKGSNH